MLACSTAKTGYCMNFAAANTSAPVGNNLDTAMLAVSILLCSCVCLLGT